MSVNELRRLECRLRHLRRRVAFAEDQDPLAPVRLRVERQVLIPLRQLDTGIGRMFGLLKPVAMASRRAVSDAPSASSTTKVSP